MPSGPSTPEQGLDLYATCAFGLEALVAGELHRLGVQVGDPKPDGPGLVRFAGGVEAIAAANIRLRTAERVYLRVVEAEAPDFDALFESVRGAPWARWIPADGSFPVRFRAVRSWLTSLPAGTRAVKRAVVESLLAGHAARELPETGAAFALEARLVGDRLSIGLDTTGEALHRRGYRAVNSGPAPLKQTLAAALVWLSGWRPGRPLIDPFCGTGTIPIEAAWIATNRAPGRDRAFAAEAWPTVGAQVFSLARDAAREQERLAPEGTHIAGYDRDEQAVATARTHAERAGVAELIHLQQRDVAELRSKHEHGVVVTNPPYGLRLDDRAAAEALYRALPGILQRLPTWSHAILTAHDGFERLVGQEATKRRKLYNGPVRCTLYVFQPQTSGAQSPGRNEDPERPALDAQAQADGGAPPASPQASPHTTRPAFGGLPQADAHRLESFRVVLAKRARHFRKWPERGIEAFRLYDRETPGVPVTIDRYGTMLHIAEHQRPTERTPAEHATFLDEVCKAAASAFGVERRDVFLKTRRRQRDRQQTREDTPGQYQRVSDRSRTCIVREHDMHFLINLSDYLDTGLFSDHRITRAMVREQARGARVLNLFAYTGSFSVAAALGGAAQVITVDLSNTYLEWARENFRLNSLDDRDARYPFVRAGAIEYLERARPGSWELVVADVPTYSNSKTLDEDWDSQRDHARLLATIRRGLAAGGVCYFACNARKFELAALEGWSSVREITRQTLPEDFRRKGAHRCWRLVAES